MDPDNNQVSNPEIDNLIEKSYEYGFTTDIESETIAPGLNEDVIRLISKKKGEPQFLLDWRLKAFRHWSKLKEPEWGQLNIEKINYQAISYFSAPKLENAPKSLDEVDPKLLETYDKLGIPLHERAKLAGVA
ncbi:MAG: Fe-S cluster assembly protein SufB, partial [Gammaproteobacteria bacterium]|nr:Fe-S cluster assembly protein SufB [Gammaproteobacteria bacterium]